MNNENNKIKENLFFAKELAIGFLSFPEWKKKGIISALFKYIIFYKKELIDFELKPLFKWVYNRKVLTFDLEKNFLEEKKSNSKNKKEKPFLTSQSLKFKDGRANVAMLELFWDNNIINCFVKGTNYDTYLELKELFENDDF